MGKNKKILKSTLEKDKRTLKFVCYMLCKITNTSNRRIGRWFKISKDTALNWFYEVDEWPAAEKVAVAKEIKFKHLPKGII